MDTKEEKLNKVLFLLFPSYTALGTDLYRYIPGGTANKRR